MEEEYDDDCDSDGSLGTENGNGGISSIFTRWFVAQNFALPYIMTKKIIKLLKKKKKRILGFYNYPVMLQFRLISTDLKPVLSHTKIV